MMRLLRRLTPAGPLAALVVLGCATARPAAPGGPAPVPDEPVSAPAGPAATDAAAPSYTRADVEFMSGMIPHHAQAVVMAGWAPSHDAGSAVRILSERIVVAQRDEIALMRTWLRDRGERVPPPDATHHRMTMDGMEHDMLMPGMLNDAQMAQLDRARGAEFDRLFLEFMIFHHEGALTMVDKLFGSYGAALDDVVFKLASDIYADQTTEIAHMQKMLDAMSSPESGR